MRLRVVAWIAILIWPMGLMAQADDVLPRVWAGLQQSQAKFTTACGTVTETRTSKLMEKPMVLHGKFCAQGTDRFMLQYTEPQPMQIRFNGDLLNITAGGKTEVMNVADHVKQAEGQFGGASSVDNLKKEFSVTAEEKPAYFEMKMLPLSPTFKRRFNYLVVKLGKRDFFPRSIEVDGKSGVNSVFAIDVTSTGMKLPDDTFAVTTK